MRTTVVLVVVVAVFAFYDVKTFTELLWVTGSLVNHVTSYAVEGHEDYEKSTRIQKK